MQTIEPLTASGSDGDAKFSGLEPGEVFRFADSWRADHLWMKTDNPEFTAVCLTDGELVDVFGDPFVTPVACKIEQIGGVG